MAVRFEDSLPQRDVIEGFRSAFWDQVGPPLRRLTLVGVLAAIMFGALIARVGTPWARGCAWGLVFVTGLCLAVFHFRRARQARDYRRVLSQIVLRCDRDAGRQALRAVRMQERSLRDEYSGSPVLAQNYVERSFSNVSMQKIESRGRRRGQIFDAIVFAGLLASGTLAVTDGHHILEGCNVALARHARAPIPMFWLSVDSVSAQPPAYLRMSEHSLLFGSRVAEPLGTRLWFRGVPIHSGVTLILTSGTDAVEFEPSADGELVARWTVNRSERLRVAARLGQVTIEQGDELIIDAETDTPPTVELDNTSRTVRLSQVDRVELFYRAKDDHGLRQIDLVMRSSDREERRPLMRLDGQHREQQGSHALSVTDPFLHNAQLPVQLRIEARDDNTLTENNWGHSDWLILDPPSPGEVENARLTLLDSIRGALIDWLAPEIVRDKDPTNSPPVDVELGRRAIHELDLALAEGHGAWDWPAPFELLLRAQQEKLKLIVQSRTSSVQTIERATLSVDAAVHSLAERDAQTVAHYLAELADDIARGARQVSSSEKKAAGIRRVDEAAHVLFSGGQQLAILGNLGADLSGIVRATLSRIGRARSAEDFTHVELAAEYLSARLRRPLPSAGATQASGVEAGVGGKGRTSRTQPSASDADVHIERLLLELQQLKEEHKSGLDLLERTLKGAEADAQLEESRSSAKQRAEGLRHLAEHLPNLGAEPESARSSEVVAREQTLGMAESIARRAFEDALKRGRAARDAANEALIRAAREPDHSKVDEKTLRSLSAELDAQSQYLEQALQRARLQADRTATGQLRDQVDKERQLAKRARVLANREKRSDAVIPDSMRLALDRASGLMDQASDSLQHSDGDRALDHEQRAQALLDQFDEKPNHGSSGRDGDVSARDKGASHTEQGTITPTGDPQAAAAFRRRVQQGLSQEVQGELGSTIRRYAEGLLR